MQMVSTYALDISTFVIFQETSQSIVKILSLLNLVPLGRRISLLALP